MITPAPRSSGAAIVRSPTLPTFTRKNSSSPVGDTSLRGTVAVIVAGAGRCKPSCACTIGPTNSSNVSAADTG